MTPFTQGKRELIKFYDKKGGTHMRGLLVALPFLALIIGMFFANRVEPFVLGMPFILFWTVLWVVLTSVIMFIVYKLDPVNQGGDSE